MNNQQSQLISDLDSEIALITHAIALDNSNSDLYLYRAVLYFNRSQHGGEGYIGTSEGNVLELSKINQDIKAFDIEYMDLAIEDLNKAITLDNKSPKAYCNRGYFLCEKARKLKDSTLIESALDDLNTAIYLDNKDPINYYDRATAYSLKGTLLDDINYIDLAIKDYTKSIILNHKFPLPYNDRGTAYWEKGKLLSAKKGEGKGNDFHHLRMSLNDYSRAIKLDAEYRDAYYNRGMTYYEMGELIGKKEYFDLAIDDFSILIEMDNKNVMAYYQRGKVLWHIEDDENAMKDFMTVLYCWSMGEAPKTCLLDSLIVLDDKLFTKNAILFQAVQDNCNVAGIEFDLFTVRKLLKDYLLIFKYIGFDYVHLMIRDLRFLKSTPIIVYYLDGCLISYRFYDEILDQEEALLSAQDYYYYVQSARHFSDDASVLIGKKSILLDAIDKVSHRLYLNDSENYYLGLLYFIQYLEEFDENEKTTQLNNARMRFNASNSFVWSKRMLDIIDNTTTSQDEFEKYLDEHCNASRELDIDVLINENATEESFLEQYSDYIHFQEVEAAFTELYSALYKTGIMTNLKTHSEKQVKFHEPLWQVFSLSDKSIHKLCERLLELNDKRVIDLIICHTSLNQLTQEEQHFIEDNYHYYTFVSDKKQAESMIINDIVNNGMKWDDLDLILRYLIEKNIIDKSQYILLPLYYKQFISEFKMAQNIETTRNILFSILELLTQNWYLVISSEALKILLNRYLDIIPEIKDEYKKYSEYEDFSNNIWKSSDELWRQETGKYYFESDDFMDNLLV